MNNSLLGALVFGALVCGKTPPVLAAPAPAPSYSGKQIAANKMPAEVRAMMVPGAKTMALASVPMGNKGAPFLLHAWTVRRRTADTSAPTVCCLDLFYRDKPNVGPWQLGYTATYTNPNPISYGSVEYRTRWLHPASKQGLVIVETTSDPTGATVRLFTLPEGVPTRAPEDQDPHFMQEFFAFYSGGHTQIEFGTDSKGAMTVENVSLWPKRAAIVFAWNGHEYAEVSPRHEMGDVPDR